MQDAWRQNKITGDNLFGTRWDAVCITNGIKHQQRQQSFTSRWYASLLKQTLRVEASDIAPPKVVVISSNGINNERNPTSAIFQVLLVWIPAPTDLACPSSGYCNAKYQHDKQQRIDK